MRVNEFCFSDVLKHVMACFERQVLVFPVLVVSLVMLSFLSGGRCAAWQWWASVVAVLGLGARYGRTGWASNAIFLLFIFLFWLWMGVFITPAIADNATCHLPAIRLLIEGWNPIEIANVESLSAAFNIDPCELQIWHLLCVSKGIWYFNAVAYFFTHETMNLQLAYFPFLLLPMMIEAVRVFRRGHMPWLVTGFVLMALVFLPPTIFFAVDVAVAYAGIGFLMTLYETSRTGRWRWLNLLAFSFWMALAKPVAIVHCIEFLLFFAVLLVRERKDFVRCSCLMLCIVSGFAFFNISPYWTMFRDYGHPLYPTMSADEKKFPSKNLTADFLDRNEDAKRLGYFGSVANAFLGPNFVRWYYREFKGIDNFSPHCRVWEHYAGAGARSVLIGSLRWGLLVCGFLVLVMGTRREGKFFLITILGLLTMPSHMIGYLRYTPWWPVVFAWAALGLASSEKKRMLACVSCGMLAFTGFRSVASIVDLMQIADYSHSARKLLEDNPPKVVYAFLRQEKRTCNTRLFLRQNLRMQDTELRDLRPENGDKQNEFCPFFDFTFLMPKEFDDTILSDARRLRKIPERRVRQIELAKFSVRSAFCIVPQLLWMKMRTIWKE